MAAYPFMKRITWWPQAWLGLAFTWGALVGWPAVPAASTGPPLLLWFGSIAWVIGYDTLYAIQDIEDDALVGVKSSARRLGDKAPLGVGDVGRVILWGAAIGASGPTGSPCSRSFRLHYILPTRLCGLIPRMASWHCGCSARIGVRLAGPPRRAGRRPFQSLGASPMQSPKAARERSLNP